MSSLTYSFLVVFITGMLGIWKAVPVGFAIGLNPAYIYLLTAAGAVSAVLILYFAGDRIRKLIAYPRVKPSSTKTKKARQLFEKYGSFGVGFLGTILMGPNMALLVGLVVVRSARALLLWTIAGILFWTLVLTLAAELGIQIFT